MTQKEEVTPCVDQIDATRSKPTDSYAQVARNDSEVRTVGLETFSVCRSRREMIQPSAFTCSEEIKIQSVSSTFSKLFIQRQFCEVGKSNY